MKNSLFQVSTATIFLLTACSTPPATVTSVAEGTVTETASLSATHTSLPTEIAPPSVTPLPTIPTFTPTFDASTIVTVTPATKAECPEIDPTIQVEDYLPQKLEYPSLNSAAKIIDFLNEGGDGQALIARLRQIYPEGEEYRGGYEFSEVTGDQSPELLYMEVNYEGRLLIFSCQQGKYELFSTLPEENHFLEYTMQVVNLNLNGIPEIIVVGTNGVSYPISTIYFYEWNGKTFTNLGHLGILALRQTRIIDIDGNGTKEISFSGDNPSCLSCKNYIPQRQRTITYGWNGKEFVEFSNEFVAPEYRFQAIQDADLLVLVGKYDQAIQLYEDAISSKQLEWWSPERLEYERALSDSWMAGITLPPEPSEDKTESDRLAAYAYFRIMLAHFVQGNKQESSLAYEELQKQFGEDDNGRPYAKMATEFWTAYQSRHHTYDGCAAAIQYASEHPEILIPLGSEYHGWQSRTYVPADVCPFR